MDRTRWNDDLPTYLEERFYTKDEIDNLLERLSLQSGLLFNLHSPNTMIRTGETNTFQSIVQWSNGIGIEDKDILFELLRDGSTMDLQTISTDSDGIAEYEYTGTGLGEVTVKAKYNDSLVKECSLLDTVTYDNGTSGSHGDIWTLNDNAVLSREPDYSELSEDTVGTGSSARVGISAGVVIDFEVLQEDGLTNKAFGHISQSSTARATVVLNNLSDNPSLNTWYSVRLIVTPSKLYIINLSTGNMAEPKNITGSFNNFAFVTANEITKVCFRNFRVYHIPLMVLEADKSIVQSSESVTFTVTLYGVENDTVDVDYQFKQDGDTISYGTATTNSNGVATFSYTGTGVGEVECIVSYSTLLQETYEVLDCLLYDSGTDSQFDDYYLANVNRTVTDNYTLLEGTGSNVNHAYFNIHGTSKSWSDVAEFNGDIRIEVDIVEYTGSCYFAKDGSQTTFINRTGQWQVDLTDLTNARLGFRLNNTASLKIKNLKVYSI